MIKSKADYKKAQSFAEYSILIAIVIGVLLTMQNYIKRSLQGRIQMHLESLSAPYHYGSTKLNESSASHARTVRFSFPGIISGRMDLSRTKGSYSINSYRELESKP